LLPASEGGQGHRVVWGPKSGTSEEDGIPEELAFATKPELAINQVRRLMVAGARALWAAADDVYGRCGKFRGTLRALSLAYVVIIPCDYRVTLARDTGIRADQAIAGAVF
jgi:SRSO17 transposase